MYHKFENLKGLRRIQCGNYRLQDSENALLINPRARPSFSLVFKPGRHVQMSIYFSWEEIQHHGCPRCRTEQPNFPGRETTCVTCAFAYVHGVQENIEEISKDGRAAVLINPERRNVPTVPLRDPNQVQPSMEDLDRPENFNRISIGAESETNIDLLQRGRRDSVATSGSSRSSLAPVVARYSNRESDLDIFREPLWTRSSLEVRRNQLDISSDISGEELQPNYTKNRRDSREIAFSPITSDGELDVPRKDVGDEGIDLLGYHGRVRTDSIADSTLRDPFDVFSAGEGNYPQAISLDLRSSYQTGHLSPSLVDRERIRNWLEQSEFEGFVEEVDEDFITIPLSRS